MATGTQDYVGDPRNDAVLISVDGALVPRDKAVVSVFDSGFVLGDGVWEGLRLIDGEVARMTEQLARGAFDEVATQRRYLELKYSGEGGL